MTAFEIESAGSIRNGVVTPVKTGGPRKTPPATPRLNPNPRRHDVVMWRNDGGISSRRFETKEAAQHFGRRLEEHCWAVYYKWVLMAGRDLVESHQIPIPAGFALDDNGMPCKV